MENANDQKTYLQQAEKPNVPKWEDGPLPPETKVHKSHSGLYILLGIVIGIVFMSFGWPRLKPLVGDVLRYLHLDNGRYESVAQQSDSGTTNTNTESSANTSKPKTKTSKLQIGEEFEIGGANVVVTDFEIIDKITANYGAFTPDEGNKYAVVSLYIENEGTSAVDFLPTLALGDDTQAILSFKGNYDYVADYLMGYDEDIHGTKLNPLTSKSGIIAFQVPDVVADSSDRLSLVIKAGSEKAEVIVR